MFDIKWHLGRKHYNSRLKSQEELQDIMSAMENVLRYTHIRKNAQTRLRSTPKYKPVSPKILAINVASIDITSPFHAHERAVQCP